MDAYKVKELQKMLEHETSKTEEHYGARLSHWYGDANVLTIDAGGLRALIRYYSKHDTNLAGTEEDGDKDPCISEIPYVFVWDGGVEVESTCTVNLRTGEVTDIQPAVTDSLETLEWEYVILNDEQYGVCRSSDGSRYILLEGRVKFEEESSW